MKRYSFRLLDVLFLLLLLLIMAGLYSQRAAAQAAPVWTPLSGEWGTFTLAAPATVRFGADLTYKIVDLAPGTYPCASGTFGGVDPVPGVGKSCAKLEPAVVAPPPAVANLPGCWPNSGTALLSFSVFFSVQDAAGVTTQASAASWLLADKDKAGVTAWWNCPKAADGSVVPGAVIDAFRSELPPLEDLKAMGSMTDAELAALWAKGATCTPTMDQTLPACARYKAHRAARDAYWAKLAPPTPPPAPAPTWVVRVNGTTATRPVYTVAQTATGGQQLGAVVSSTLERVAVGAPCDCSVASFVNSASSYCSVAGQVNAASSLVPKAKLPGNRVSVCTVKIDGGGK